MRGHTEFIRAALAEFPTLDLELCDGPYDEMAVFEAFTQHAKHRADWDTYGRAVRLAAGFLPDADPELHNELHVSFLEHLDFEGADGPRAWALMPVALQKAWHDIISYNERLLGRPWAQTKPKVSSE